MPVVTAGQASGAAGKEISYTQVTSSVPVASTTEATGTTIIAPGAIVFDGAPVLLTFYCYAIRFDSVAIGDVVITSLFEGATQISRIGYVNTVETTAAEFTLGNFVYRFTPSAGSHTYTITAFATSLTGSPTFAAANGGTGGAPPMFARFTKV